MTTTQVTTRLDLKKYNAKRLPIEAQIRVLKELISTPGRGGSWKEYADLTYLQYQATILYMARAEQRNKLHALVRVTYRRDPTASPYGNTEIIDGVVTQLNVNAKCIDPVTREEQQKAIARELAPIGGREGLLQDLYVVVPVIVREVPGTNTDSIVTEENRPYPAPVSQTWAETLPKTNG